ncbi:MAG: NUDIX hydrolase [Bacteroidetes bacterium]|nr:NUDIX hydrolase [Bacteroidota bacterium]
MTEFTQETINSIRKDISESIPQLSINNVIFRFREQTLQFPVVQPANSNLWMIPGGYVHQNESIDNAAKRILFEQTQINDLLLSQFGTFGSTDRHFENQVSTFRNLEIPKDIIEWISKRFVTIGYYSVLRGQNIEIKSSPFFKNVKWMNIEDSGKLALDHSVLVSEARKVLAKELLSQPLLQSFMPTEFTIPELQKLYEAILGRSIDRGNFRKRMLKSNSLIKIGQQKEKTKQRPPDLYRLDKEKYLSSLTQDIKFGF